MRHEEIASLHKVDKLSDESYLQIDGISNGIGTENERSLHSSIRKWYLSSGDICEVKIDGYIIDIVRGDILIEIQTKNFSAMGKKLRNLIKNHKVRLIYPIAEEKWITTVCSDDINKIIRTRKSPKKGRIFDLVNELVSISDVINSENFSLEVLLIKENEIRCDDGKGSWRRKGVSILDRRLLEVTDSIVFNYSMDYSLLLPNGLPGKFTNKDYSEYAGITINKARKATYCMRKIGILKVYGKKGNTLIFEKE